MRIRSVIDIRIKMMVFLVIGVMLALSAVLTLTMAFTLAQAVWGYFAVLLASGLLLWLLYGTYYELRDDHLYCKSGPFIEIIPYEAIAYLALSDNNQSCLALSTRRIEIHHYSGGYKDATMISPQSRELFLARLRQRCVNQHKASPSATLQKTTLSFFGSA